MGKYLLGTDNGGTVAKAAVFDLQGHEIAAVSRKTEMLTPRPGHTERDVEAMWQATATAIREAIDKSNIDAVLDRSRRISRVYHNLCNGSLYRAPLEHEVRLTCPGVDHVRGGQHPAGIDEDTAAPCFG